MRGKRLAVVGLVVLCAGIGVLAAGRRGPAPKSKVDAGAFLREIMAMKIDGDRMEMAIWFPYEFFAAAAAAGAQGEEGMKEIAVLKPYVVVVAMAQDEEADGTKKPSSESDLRGRAVLRLADGTEIKPVDKPPPKILVLLAAMKAGMAAQAGATGENAHILVFPNESKGKPVVDVAHKDRLTLVLKAQGAFAEAVFTWRTPFDALNPAPACAKCKGEISSKWSFCPWCGTKAPEAATAPAN
jgi:hypothetical protein